jgi:hypothetical protein
MDPWLRQSGSRWVIWGLVGAAYILHTLLEHAMDDPRGVSSLWFVLYAFAGVHAVAPAYLRGTSAEAQKSSFGRVMPVWVALWILSYGGVYLAGLTWVPALLPVGTGVAILLLALVMPRPFNGGHLAVGGSMVLMGAATLLPLTGSLAVGLYVAAHAGPPVAYGLWLGRSRRA